LLIYRPDYEQHLIAFDMIHLVCESNSPILPVSFISLVSYYPASACRARRGALQKRLNRSQFVWGQARVGLTNQVGDGRIGRTLAALGEIDRTIRARQRCVLTSNYFNRL